MSVRLNVGEVSRERVVAAVSLSSSPSEKTSMRPRGIKRMEGVWEKTRTVSPVQRDKSEPGGTDLFFSHRPTRGAAMHTATPQAEMAAITQQPVRLTRQALYAVRDDALGKAIGFRRDSSNHHDEREQVPTTHSAHMAVG